MDTVLARYCDSLRFGVREYEGLGATMFWFWNPKVAPRGTRWACAGGARSPQAANPARASALSHFTEVVIISLQRTRLEGARASPPRGGPASRTPCLPHSPGLQRGGGVRASAPGNGPRPGG